MNFEVDRYSSAWAHIALCADLTWASEPPDEFFVANQRLWAQHCRVSQVLQDTTVESTQGVTYNQCETSDKRGHTNIENGSNSGVKSVRDVIPESRLAQHYGNFYYDETRESCYTNASQKLNDRYNGHGCEKSDLTECWMLPEVEYWFRKLVDDTPERSLIPRRRRQYRMTADDDLCVSQITSERWGPIEAKTFEEANLEARIRSVRALWTQNHIQTQASQARTPSPPPAPRKIRARRRQPRRLGTLAPPAPAYCLDLSTKLLCDPSYKFQFDVPRPPHLAECQRAIGRLSVNVQAVMRAAASRCPPYRGTQVSRYAPTGQRPLRCPDRRYGIWWPRDHPSPRLDHRLQFNHIQSNQKKLAKPKLEIKKEIVKEKDSVEQSTQSPTPNLEQETSKQSQRAKIMSDGQEPTSTAALEIGRKKRLYSTVLSMSPPPQMNVNSVGCVRLSKKLTPGLIKLNPKLVLSTRLRTPNVDKFEELEKEALEQYKASDESIDTKFSELEKQAEEQYSNSNSNTSCSSDNSTKKKSSPQDDSKSQSIKFHKGKSVDSVVIYSQNFPDLDSKGRTKSIVNLKNFHAPPRGEKKEQSHRSSKRNLKSDSQRAASDTDYEARNNQTKGSHKGAMRWTLHVMSPKKRHISASDVSSDEELEDTCHSMRDVGPCLKSRILGKAKMSAHGGGDLQPIIRKT